MIRMDPQVPRPEHKRLAITVRGVVQGVGFRPFVFNTAVAQGLSGWVLNEADSVRLEVQGDRHSLDGFLAALRDRHPPAARIDELAAVEVAPSAAASTDLFVIRQSGEESRPRPTIPADLATCPECLAEIQDAEERRHRYPFTNCTNCGPRWSIIERLPYDRPRTSMRSFEMCKDCRREYDEPLDRRFHAQPIACPKCGPSLQLLTSSGDETDRDDAALQAACEAVRAGRILALKGLGGFQLIVDATNQDAVGRLRDRKHRPDKPFAVMTRDLQKARTCCEISHEEAAMLQSHQAPILLMPRLQSAAIAQSVAPGNPYLGLMLPCTPLHHLLMQGVDRPVVCTSGNRAEEPMATSTEEAIASLGSIADLILTHNRPIVRPVDDSVARIQQGRLQLVRRARGFAPLPIRVNRDLPTILAVGGHLKNTVALSMNRDIVLTPHIGDLDNSLSVAVQRRAVEDLLSFFDVRLDAVACDLHPDYASTRLAEQLASKWNVPLVRTQHHHAHVAACRAEHGIDGPLLGFSWDGTGYGTDGTAWGGEVLLCRGHEFDRIGHLRSFALPGGDRAAREPRRSALGVLHEILPDSCAEIVERWFPVFERKLLLHAMSRPGLFPRTSSMGRLFDAVSAISGLSDHVSFEGQSAMALEFAVDQEIRDAYPSRLVEGEPKVLDWEPTIRAVLDDVAAGEPLGHIASRFHNALADMAVAVAQAVSCPQIALTGGCFQNWTLTRRLCSRLSESGFTVYTHQQVPPGDGGIALGQVLIAAEKIEEG